MTKIIKKKAMIPGIFDNEEYASIVYQILQDNKLVEYIHLEIYGIEYGVVEVRE